MCGILPELGVPRFRRPSVARFTGAVTLENTGVGVAVWFVFFPWLEPDRSKRSTPNVWYSPSPSFFPRPVAASHAADNRTLVDGQSVHRPPCPRIAIARYCMNEK